MGIKCVANHSRCKIGVTAAVQPLISRASTASNRVLRVIAKLIRTKCRKGFPSIIACATRQRVEHS